MVTQSSMTPHLSRFSVRWRPNICANASPGVGLARFLRLLIVFALVWPARCVSPREVAGWSFKEARRVEFGPVILPLSVARGHRNDDAMAGSPCNQCLGEDML